MPAAFSTRIVRCSSPRSEIPLVPRMYRVIDLPPLRATSRGLRRAAASPRAAQPVNSSFERWPFAPPKPPSLFWIRSRYLVAFDAGEAAEAVPANARSITPATTAAGRQRTSNRRR